MKKLRSESMVWPKGLTIWIVDRTLYVSVSFTWDLPKVKDLIDQTDFTYDRIFVGGPATILMPDYLPAAITSAKYCAGALQRVNPMATRTSRGCIRSCKFCAVPKTEGSLVELDDWPDLPILVDNNLLACSVGHFDRVMDRLEKHPWSDFNQGIDSRLLTPYHAERFKRLNNPMLRLALDNMNYSDQWHAAMGILTEAGIPKYHIRSYALIGFDSDPEEAWRRCLFIEKSGIKALPMWFHSLDCMERQGVSKEQAALRWTNFERRRILQWFYQHKRAVA